MGHIPDCLIRDNSICRQQRAIYIFPILTAVMKKFITNLIVFLLLSIASLVLFWSVLASTRKIYCTTDAHILICGNSTVEYGVDDSLIPHSLNIGFNADHMDFIYAKIKMIKKYSPAVDTILIAIDDALISKDVSQGYNSELHHPYYYDQYDANDIWFILNNASIDWIESTIARPCGIIHLKAILSNIGDSSAEFKDLGIGGYYKLDRHKLEEDLLLHDSDDKTSENSDGKDMYKYSVYFLNKIKDFCDKNDMKLIFFTTPKHSRAQTFGYRYIHNEFFPDVDLYDFTTLPLPNIYYGDTYHLNTNGAQVFTPILYNAIKN